MMEPRKRAEAPFRLSSPIRVAKAKRHASLQRSKIQQEKDTYFPKTFRRNRPKVQSIRILATAKRDPLKLRTWVDSPRAVCRKRLIPWLEKPTAPPSVSPSIQPRPSKTKAKAQQVHNTNGHERARIKWSAPSTFAPSGFAENET